MEFREMASEAHRSIEMLRDKWKSLDTVLDHLKSETDDLYKGFEEAKVVRFSTDLGRFESVVDELKDRVEKIQDEIKPMADRGRVEEAQKKEK